MLKIGDKFGRLEIISLNGLDRYSHRHWLCRCDCGVVKVVSQGSLQNGLTRSCGCLMKELAKKRATIHGHFVNRKVSPEYSSWSHMLTRCYNKNNNRYKDYGGRGIKVCGRWRHSFPNFLTDLGLKPSSKHTIERIDVNKDYAPENCCWATQKEQQSNRRNTVEV